MVNLLFIINTFLDLQCIFIVKFSISSLKKCTLWYEIFPTLGHPLAPVLLKFVILSREKCFSEICIMCYVLSVHEKEW